MDVKGEVLISFQQKQVRNGNKTFLEPKFFSIYSQIEEIRVSCPFKENV